MFIRTEASGNAVNISEIVKISTYKDGATAELRDGSSVRLRPGAMDLIDRATSPVLPAQPGFELLSARFGSDRVFFARAPIIGWRIEPYGPAPIVLDDWDFTESEDCQTAVRYPDGQVVMPRDEDFTDETAWCNAMEVRRQEYREKNGLAAE